MWQWTSRTSEIGNQTMALLMFWGSTKETMATSNWCLGLEWESNGYRMITGSAETSLPLAQLSDPAVPSSTFLPSPFKFYKFHYVPFSPFWPFNFQRDECHKVSRVSNLKVLAYLGYCTCSLHSAENMWIWMALSSSSSSCWTFGASFAKGSDAVPQDPDIPDIPNLLELLGVKSNFRSCRTARATSCDLQPASDYLTICVARRHDKFLAVFAIASIACQDLTKKESCYKAATWHTACLAKISSHLLRLLANHATGSCLAQTKQVQGKDFTATMTSPIPLNPLKWSPILACTTFRYKCLYLKHGPKSTNEYV